MCVCVHRAECKVYGEEDVDIAQPTEMTMRSAPPKEMISMFVCER